MRKLWLTGALVLLGTVAVATLAPAQTTSNGPYYATPSWDQQLPASTRFIVLLNWASAAVLDRETGLVWEQSPDTGTRDWASSRFFCDGQTTGGRGGWRLPTIQELTSLTAFLPSGHPFANVQGTYWSATSDPFGAANTALFSLSGSTIRSATGVPDHAWCVRGGLGVAASP